MSAHRITDRATAVTRATAPVAGPAAAPVRPMLAPTDTDDALDHAARWEAHVAAGRIGRGPAPAPAGFDRMQSLDRILGIGRVGRW